ncbi:helix-turn-helix transcriptional regulator [Agrococcus sp. Marseille-P2731]|uniref:helix-turn-helix transcriptional regulator n=1 Tax=Agrococcus sp. Marseille-P2731 TaxID=1841862 RepID=UPI0013565D78|nr:helix-turn-helix domain-containing protein [Agrococcus sp. Marseille-P2731]
MATTSTKVHVPAVDLFAISPGTLVDPEFLSAVLGISLKTLRNWRDAERGPRAMRYARVVKYKVGDVTRWLENQENED